MTGPHDHCSREVGALRPKAGPEHRAARQRGRRAAHAWPRALLALKRANAPAVPEDSALLRFVTALAVIAGLAACETVGELTVRTAALGSVAVAVGMVFSHLTRRRPWSAVKVVLAATVVAVFAVFVHGVLAQAEAGSLASVEGPLAVLFVWIQATHAFDVPARRDLLFSIVASAAFVAVASAQAIETSFLVIVLVWLLLCVVALALSWQSVAGRAHRVPFGTVALCTGVAAMLAALLVALLPAPHPSQLITLPNSLSTRLSLPDQGSLTGGTAGTQPARPAAPGGVLGLGGYAGFADTLDTAVRGSLGNEVVMRVRATRPGYFEALSYREWNGTSWLNPPMAHGLLALGGGSPFDVPTAGAAPAAGSPAASVAGSGRPSPGEAAADSGDQDVQTFYVAQPLADILVAAPDPLQVWFPASRLYTDLDDGSIRSPVAITPGTVYTVVSANSQQSPSVLAADREPVSRFAAADPTDLQLPHAYPAVKALALRVTAHAPTVYAKVMALQAWMQAHVRYTTDIPPLLPGEDAVTQFLFRDRIGFCEQISTALAVMLRTLGIPAREVTGYIPGPYNPLTDLYEVQAKDAHAWVKVWFPGYGWQSFDPTANVPLANPSPGGVLAVDAGHLLRHLPVLPAGLVLAAAALLAAAGRAWRRRPRTWAERVARILDRTGATWGVERAASETLGEFTRRLAAARQPERPPAAAVEVAPAGEQQLASAVAVLEGAAYGCEEPDAPTRRRIERTARSLRRRRISAARARLFRA
jgi:transglutaminase-like putative cysteine protease